MNFRRRLRILRAGKHRPEAAAPPSCEPISSARAAANVARLWRSNISNSSSVIQEKQRTESFTVTQEKQNQHFVLFHLRKTKTKTKKLAMLRLCERLRTRHMLLSRQPSGPAFLHIYQVDLNRICPGSVREVGKRHVSCLRFHVPFRFSSAAAVALARFGCGTRPLRRQVNDIASQEQHHGLQNELMIPFL